MAQMIHRHLPEPGVGAIRNLQAADACGAALANRADTGPDPELRLRRIP